MTPAEYAARAWEFENAAAELIEQGRDDLAELTLMIADELHEDADRAEREAAA